MQIFRKSFLLIALSSALVNSGLTWRCDGDVPWDPCGVLTSDDVPDNEADAKIFLTKAPDTAKQIHNSPLTISVIDRMGLLGDYTDKSKNAAAIELLMWQSGFDLPTRKVTYTDTYKVEDFYNGSYGFNFQMFIPPFDYAKGWNRCQFLRYTPTQAEIGKAREILNQLNHFIQAVTTEYKTKSASDESTQQLIERQTKFNKDLENAVKNFNYDAYMSYARAELNNYITQQANQYYTGKTYANWGCKKEVSGQVLVY